jgi:hypothetical protein
MGRPRREWIGRVDLRRAARFLGQQVRQGANRCPWRSRRISGGG